MFNLFLDAEAAKQRQEDIDYLEKLRKIRMQNYHDKKNIAGGGGDPAVKPAPKPGNWAVVSSYKVDSNCFYHSYG